MSDLPIVECSLCGRDGEPPAGCGLCHGRAPVQSRAHTLSDIRSGRVKDEDRYSGDAVKPRTSPYVTDAGSFSNN